MTLPDLGAGSVIDGLRGIIDSAGYTEAGLTALLGPYVIGAFDDGWLAPFVSRTVSGAPLDLLVRLFWAALGVDEAALRAAFGSPTVAGWARAGFLVHHGDQVAAAVLLQPVAVEGADWVIAHDARRSASVEADHVLGVTPSSRLLLDYTVRRRAGRALDLGAGSGIQAVVASRHCDAVVATDRSARATHFARLTAALNGVTNVECRTGDLFDPVIGESFDLIVSNPPFVVSPANDLIYRDSGLPADEICARVVTGGGRHLSPGGWCVVTANWIHREGERWEDRLRGWVNGTGCSTWVVQRGAMEAGAYAMRWLSDDRSLDAGERERRYGVWMEYYRREGIVAVGTGIVVLHKTADPHPWFRAEQSTGGFYGPCGEALARTFELHDWLDAHRDDHDLLGSRLHLAPDARLDATSSAADGVWEPERLVMRHDGGLRTSFEISGAAADFLAGLDGRLTLGEVLADWGAPLEDHEAVAGVLSSCRDLVRQGFLLPGPPGPSPSRPQ